MTGDNSGKPSGRGGLAMAGVGVLMVACRALPLLIAEGALGALGGQPLADRRRAGGGCGWVWWAGSCSPWPSTSFG